jgi:hypothetical protein
VRCAKQTNLDNQETETSTEKHKERTKEELQKKNSPLLDICL